MTLNYHKRSVSTTTPQSNYYPIFTSLSCWQGNQENQNYNRNQSSIGISITQLTISLKIWIPDTVILNDGELPPMWLYSNP